MVPNDAAQIRGIGFDEWCEFIQGHARLKIEMLLLQLLQAVQHGSDHGIGYRSERGGSGYRFFLTARRQRKRGFTGYGFRSSPAVPEPPKQAEHHHRRNSCQDAAAVEGAFQLLPCQLEVCLVILLTDATRQAAVIFQNEPVCPEKLGGEIQFAGRVACLTVKGDQILQSRPGLRQQKVSMAEKRIYSGEVMNGLLRLSELLLTIPEIIIYQGYIGGVLLFLQTR